MKVDYSSMQATIDSIINHCLAEHDLTWEAFAYSSRITKRHKKAWQMMQQTSSLITIEMIKSYKSISAWRINNINNY